MVVGPLTTGSGGPAGDEGPDQGGVEAVIRGRVVRRQGAAVKIATHTEAGNQRRPTTLESSQAWVTLLASSESLLA